MQRLGCGGLGGFAVKIFAVKGQNGLQEAVFSVRLYGHNLISIEGVN